MAKNIKSSTIPPKLAPYISIIPKIQIESNQVQKVPESSINQVEYRKINNDTKFINNDSIYQPNSHTSNNFSSSEIKTTNDIIEHDNTISSLHSNKSSLIPQKHEIIPQLQKSQKTIINHLNSNDHSSNTSNLASISNIDIILNKNSIEERNKTDIHTGNASSNLNNPNKNDIIITKNNNNITHQIISPKNRINTNTNICNINNNGHNITINSPGINNIDNSNLNNSNNFNRSNNPNNHNIDIASSLLNNQNGCNLDIKPIISDNNIILNNNIIQNNASSSSYNNNALLNGIPSNPNPKPSTSKNKKSPAYRKTMWTHAEDQILIKTVSRHGTNNWELVSNEVAGRTRKQCRERWAGILNPNLTKQPWTTEEDETLKMLHAQYGNKWAMIAAQMKGRSTIALRNRWSFHMRHSYREVKQAPYRYIIENRNNDFNNESSNLNLNLNQQQITPVIQQQQTQQQQQLPIQNQLQLIQSIQVMPNPYQQVQQQNICNVYPVLNQSQPQPQQKQIFQPNQIGMQNIQQYQPIQIIQQPYEQQPQPQPQPQMVNASIKVVELPNNNMNNPPNFC